MTAAVLRSQAARRVSASRAAAPALEPVKAPWIRPGVVVHDPDETVDGLLGGFALTLRERGFSVAGYVHRHHRGCTGAGDGCAERLPYVDLSDLSPLSVERGAAERYLRKAMRENADLMVVSRFSACLEATTTVQAAVGPEPTQGLPLLTSIAGQCIHKWHSYMRHEGAMLAPSLEALWRWWGPEHLYRDLALGVAADPVRRIACGPRWILVEGPHGAGLAYLPRRATELTPRLPGFARQSLRDLADLSQSWNPLEMALGIAAINAHYNRFDLEAAVGNGAEHFRPIARSTVVIGAFPGVDAILPGCAVIEIDPRPGEFPIVAMDALLPGAGGAIVNSSALINRSLPRILRLAQHRRTALVGPSTPLTPRLHDYGVAVLGGFIARDVEGLAAAVRAGATAREFSRFGRFVHAPRGAG